MTPEYRQVSCHHTDYDGPERREGERREQCGLHSGLQQSYDDLKDLQEKACRKIDRVTVAIDSKVPMKLFYVMIGLIVAILAFQWTTYERVNKIAVDNQAAYGELKLTIEKVSSTVSNHQDVNEVKLDSLANSVEKYTTQADKEREEIKMGIKEVKEDIQEVKKKVK